MVVFAAVELINLQEKEMLTRPRQYESCVTVTNKKHSVTAQKSQTFT